MIRAKSDVRLGIVGATAGLAALMMAAVSASATQAGAVATGPHANEPFCTPENLAASRRISEYCGVKATAVK